MRIEYFAGTEDNYRQHAEIFDNKIDFSYMPRGWKTPELSNLKRLASRKTELCTNQKIIVNIV